MMTSFPNNIPTIIKAAAELKPKSVLDVGAGFGKFGLLLREALLSMQAEAGNMYPEPDFAIYACENAGYFLKQRALTAIYDGVNDQDIRTYTAEDFTQFDLILLIDVIEHWPKQDFLDLMTKIDPSKTKVLVSTPKEVVFYEEPYYGIDKHQTQFAAWDFTTPGAIDLSTSDSFIFLL